MRHSGFGRVALASVFSGAFRRQMPDRQNNYMVLLLYGLMSRLPLVMWEK
jgi:hypothetical protein